MSSTNNLLRHTILKQVITRKKTRKQLRSRVSWLIEIKLKDNRGKCNTWGKEMDGMRNGGRSIFRSEDIPCLLEDDHMISNIVI